MILDNLWVVMLVSTISVPGVLLDELTTARRAGEEFATAWPLAVARALAGLDRAEASDWEPVLRQTRGDWHQAWDRRPARHLDFAMHMLADGD